MDVTIKEILDVGDDVLLVRGDMPVATEVQRHDEAGEPVFDDAGEPVFETVLAPEPIEARGWVSATTNHFDAHAYDADGNRADDAEPRTMTPAEVGAYALSLLVAQNDLESAPAAAPTPITFEPPKEAL